MNIHYLKLIVAGFLLVGAAGALAQETDARIVAIANPKQSNGIHIGDVLKRSIVLEVRSPYQISKNSYPVKGSNQDGMELVDLRVDSAAKGDNIRYQLDLSYQVFANTQTPAVMKLPAEKLVLTGGPKALTVNVPAWHFWFSPLVSADISTAKANLQPQQSPELVDMHLHQARLLGFVSLLAAALVSIVYINADNRWLPFMGGAFAQAHRRIKRLPHAVGEEKKALLYMHQAFNQMHGGSLFAQDIEAFLAKHPGFARMKHDIVDFFQRSNKALFVSPPGDRTAFMRELVALSKGLRDCERGLR